MADKSATVGIDEDMLRVGKAVRALRESRKLTQEQSAAAVRPNGWTSQYWGMIETGRVPGVFKPAMQRKLIEALNDAAPGLPALTPEDLDAAMDADPQEARLARMARELQPDRASAGQAEFSFPTRDGYVSLRYPERMTAGGLDDLETFLGAFLATLRAAA